jgi:hypothetical protein
MREHDCQPIGGYYVLVMSTRTHGYVRLLRVAHQAACKVGSAHTCASG